jgi:hypothetical protein
LKASHTRKSKGVISDGRCGLDIGPSAIAAVGEEDALLAQFCAEVVIAL